MSGLSNIIDNDLAKSVLPTPASPSRRIGFLSFSVKYIAVLNPTLDMYPTSERLSEI